MSTDYFRFKTPVTSIRTVTEGAHDKVSVWINHQLSGVLVVDHGANIADLFVDHNKRVFETWALQSGKVATHCFDKSISEDEYVISEYFEICQAKDLLKNAVNMDEGPALKLISTPAA